MSIQAEPKQLLYHQYGVIWLFYSQKPESQDMNDRILSLYRQLDIELKKGIVSNSDQMQTALEAPQIQRTKYIKLANIGGMQSKSSKNTLKQMKKDKQLNQITFSQSEWESILYQSFSQMREYTCHLNLHSIFHSIDFQDNNNLLQELLTLYACTNDKLCERKTFIDNYQKKFGKLHNFKNSNEIMEKYLKDQTFRSFLQVRMNRINDHNTSSEIGYAIRKLFEFIKSQSKAISQPNLRDRKKQYKKLIRWKIEDLNYLKKDSIYYINTFQKFSQSQNFDYSQQIHTTFDKNKSIFAMIIIDSQSQGSNMINNGVYQINNYAYFNCLNYFQFIKATRIDKKNQLCDFCCYYLEFRMITQEYWRKGLLKTINNGQINFLDQKIFQFLQEKQQNVTFQDVFIYTKDFAKTKLFLTQRLQKNMKVKSQYCEKIGVLPALLSENKINQVSSLKQTAQSYKLAKGFNKYHYLTIVLKKQIQLLSERNTNHIFSKDLIKLNKKKIQLLLIINQMPQIQQNLDVLLTQIYEDIKKAASILSHRKIDELNKFQEPQPQRGCCYRLFIEKPLSEKQIITKNDQRLQKHFFSDIQNSISRSKQLKQLKQQLLFLYQSYLKAVVDINRFRNHLNKFPSLQQNVKVKQQFIKDMQVLRSPKTKQKEDSYDDDNNIQSFLSTKESEISTLQSEFQNLSQIRKTSQRCKKGDTLNNSAASLRESKYSLEANKDKNKKISIQLQKKLQEIQKNLSQQNNRQYREASKLYAKNLLICNQVLKEQGYTVNSLKMIKLYRKLANVYVKTGNIIQLQKLTQIIFFQQQHPLTLKAQLHSYLATLAYNKKNFELSLNQIQKSCQLLQNVVKKTIQKDREYASSINNKKIIELKILSFKVLCSQMRLYNKQQQQQRIQALLTSIQRLTQQSEETIGQERFKIYRIELKLLQIMVEEIKIQIEQKKFTNESLIANNQLKNNLKAMKLENISKSLQIKQDIAKIYGMSLKYALIIIDIMIKRHNVHEISKQFKVQALQAKVQQNFQIIEQIFKMQSQGEQRVKYLWILQLSRFFKERENNKRLFQISQSRRLIQACLHQFKKVKLLDRMDTDLQRYYETIFSLYRKFMKKYLKTYPIRQNILESNQGNNEIPPSKMENSSQSLEDPRYNHQIIWLFCINSKLYALDQLQMIGLLQKQKLIRTNIISCISDSSKFFFDSLIRLRDTGKYIIKGVIEIDSLPSSSKNVSRDYIISKLKKFDEITIIMKAKNTDNEIDVNLMKTQIGKKLRIIQKNKFEQLLNQYKIDMTSENMTKRNTIFFLQQFYHQKNTNYHTIINSCISHTVNQQLLRNNISLETYKELVQKFIDKNERVQHFNNNSLINTINQLFQFKKKYQQNCRKLQKKVSKQQIEKIKETMLKLSQSIIQIYTDQNIFYHFVNNNLRILYENPERVPWQLIQPFIYILYHSILLLFSKQRKQPRNYQPNSLKVWRIAQMKNEQYNDYANIYSKKNSYIKYMSFLSTSSSFQWIQKQLLKRTNGSPGQMSKYAIIQIQVDNEGEKGYQMMDNGFVTVPNKAQFEILFNILCVFMVNQVSKVKIDQIASLEERVFTGLTGREIIYIKLKLVRNFSHLCESKQVPKPIQYFYNFQQQFNKQRIHYQKYSQVKQLQQFRISSYNLIQAYIDLGLLAKAEEFIKLELQRARESPIKFMRAIFGDEQNPQNSKNLLHKLISIHMKRGQHRKAQELFQKYDKQLKELKKKILQQADIRVLAQKSYEMKKQMIELFHDQFNIEQYQNKINEIQRQINRLDQSTYRNKIKKRQEIIYLHLHRSIYHFQNNKIKQSLQFFKQTLEKIKELCVPSESFNSVKSYCENIIKCLRNLFGKYQCLNNNHYSENIKELATYFKEAIERVSQKQNKQYSGTQLNLFCCQKNAESLQLHQQNMSESQISNIAQNFEIESQASDNIASEISQNIQLLPYRDRIKYINFCLLGKVESQKQRVVKCSLTNMEAYLNTFQKVSQKLNTYQVEDLKRRGFRQQSLELIRCKRKKARLALSKMNDHQFYNQIEAIFTYCRDKQSHRLEQCRALILQAQFEQIKLQKKLMANNYKMQVNDNNAYLAIHSKLNDAKEKLELAYSRNHNKNFFSSLMRKTDDAESKSQEYLAIMMLRVKITYQQYFQTGGKDSNQSQKSKENLNKALQLLDSAIANRQKMFNVLNEEIYLQSIRSQFSILIIKDPSLFNQSFSKFNKGIKKRQQFRGMNNLQNAIDCIELLQIFDVFHDQSIMSNVSERDRERLYIYVKEGARNSQNNQLFWRFIRCIFTRIVRKSYKNDLDYILAKLQFIFKALKQIKRLKIIDQLSITKMQQTYQKFIKYSKQMKSVESFDSVKAKKVQIEKMIMDINDKNQRKNQESQDNMSVLPQNSNKDIKQQLNEENIPLNQFKPDDRAQLNQSDQKFIKSAQKYQQQESNQELSSFNYSPQKKYKPLIDRDISLEGLQL